MDKRKKPRYSKAINKVNNDMYVPLNEIIRAHALRYLPAKSLCRSKAVSKDWESVISTPSFEHSQSYFSRSLSGLFGQSPEGSIFFVSPDPMAYGVPDPEMKFLPEPVDLVASSNGLLCCRGRTGDRTYYICNPANQQWRELPKPKADHGVHPALVLVYEPSLRSFQANYRLVCASPSTLFRCAYEFEVYSSTDNMWKTSSKVCFSSEGQPRVLDRGGIHLNGVVYWLTSDNFLLAFDWMMHTAKLIRCNDADFGSDTLGILNGKPCFSRRIGPKLIKSVLSNVRGNTAQMSLETQVLVIKDKPIFDDTNELGRTVVTIGSDLIVFHDGWTIFSYNLKTKKTQSFGIKSDYPNNCFYVPYVSSLVSL